MNSKDRDPRKPARTMGQVRLPVESNRELFRSPARKNFAIDDDPLNTVRALSGLLLVALRSLAVPFRSIGLARPRQCWRRYHFQQQKYRPACDRSAPPKDARRFVHR